MQPGGNLVADLICRTAEIGLTITGAADAGNITIIDAAPVSVDGLCPECGNPGKLRDHIVRPLVDLPVVGLPTRLHVRVPRLTCSYPACGRKISRPSWPAPMTVRSSPTEPPAGSCSAWRLIG